MAQAPKGYDRVGGGTYDVYKKKPTTDWVGVIGCIAFVAFIIAAIF
ncbi:hypothetical protein [Hyphomicrobium sp. D-2]|nr:hypothetical protein [Hyphomicrobium sp. D-2]MDH4980955.1 hypothetical protein [Hyphomicrobium sp. D-2]